MVRSLLCIPPSFVSPIISHLGIAARYLLYCVKITCLVGVFSVHNVLWYTSRDLFYKMASAEGYMTGLCAVVSRVQDYAASLTTYAAFKVMASDLFSHATQRSFKGFPAPNTKVFMTDNKACGIVDLGKQNRPLVLNFGAVTCPIFAENLGTFNDLFKEFAHIADFLVVYTRESHASNEWRFDNAAHSIPQHNSVAERLRAARLVTEHYGVESHVVADDITNVTSLAYGVFPMRLYVLYNGVVYYEGSCGPIGYNMHDIRTVLDNFKRKQI